MSIIDSAALTRHLISIRNPDGGWGYYRGKSSRLESTAWVLLALSQQRGADLGTRVLASWPSRDGLLLEHPGSTPNYGFHGLALLVLAALHLEHDAGNRTLTAGIQRVKGIQLENGPANPTQDNRLQAWSWIADTFSWVEPTGWCLLAVKQRLRTAPGDVDRARIAEAEKLLINRACVSGGWNYGNADVLGQDLRAYVPTTAIGLLAMQDRLDDPVVRRSLEFLQKQAGAESSGSALALAAIALRRCGKEHAAVRSALESRLPATVEFGNAANIAMALYALTAADGYDAFAL